MGINNQELGCYFWMKNHDSMDIWKYSIIFHFDFSYVLILEALIYTSSRSEDSYIL